MSDYEKDTKSEDTTDDVEIDIREGDAGSPTSDDDGDTSVKSATD